MSARARGRSFGSSLLVGAERVSYLVESAVEVPANEGKGASQRGKERGRVRKGMKRVRTKNEPDEDDRRLLSSVEQRGNLDLPSLLVVHLESTERCDLV